MEDTVVLYTSAEHLNSMLVLAKFISKHYPSIPLLILCSAPESAAASVATVPSITYHRLPPPALPPNLTTNPLELLFEIPRLNNPNVSKALQEISQKSRIKAFVIDFFCNPVFEVSTGLNIPTYFYISSGAFGLCPFLNFPTIEETVPGDLADLNDFVEIPGCPPVHSSDFPEAMIHRKSNIYKHFMDAARNMAKSTGNLVNAFDALEFRAKEALINGLCIPNAPTPPVYLVGPLVGDSNRNNGCIQHECLKWLDSQPSKSVIFLCFGRRGLFSVEQLKEMALGLENSGYRFLWSVRSPPGKQNSAAAEPDLDELLPKGFLERTKDRGFIIKSWAPQTEVLSHDSVGGFVTHCGRSSILEAVSLGVPMIGWPLYAEQRMNRVFMVEEMKVALPLEETADGLVTAVELEKRVRQLMDSQTGRAVRHRVTELKSSAAAAVRKNGSSLVALQNFIASVTRV
ncbi:baicalein 7-O-glucuronosyltransferase-like [Sesamum indicum]|uniref:Glycosyltransferase n=1 Tax=Sesamum indicum TaxID=4182 RepID=B2NID1_SESIN|nr:baicalein 7-O-glucuronosyltransferase-like [Sesamum indicum]BAG31947.1 UGT88D6 [Sesamum indicum]